MGRPRFKAALERARYHLDGERIGKTGRFGRETKAQPEGEFSDGAAILGVCSGRNGLESRSQNAPRIWRRGLVGGRGFVRHGAVLVSVSWRGNNSHSDQMQTA